MASRLEELEADAARLQEALTETRRAQRKLRRKQRCAEAVAPGWSPFIPPPCTQQHSIRKGWWGILAEAILGGWGRAADARQWVLAEHLWRVVGRGGALGSRSKALGAH